jgi:hypothetical protein
MEKTYTDACTELNSRCVKLKHYVQQQIPSQCNMLLASDVTHLQYTFPVYEMLRSSCVSSHNSKEMLQTSSSSINTRKDTCDHALSHSFTGRGAPANGLTDIKMRW